MNRKFTLTIACILLFCCLLGCNSKDSSQYTQEVFMAGAEYQHQKDISLTLSRYIAILENTQNSKTNTIKKDIDFWIDLGIIELSYQEDENVRKKLPIELQNEINKIKHNLNAYQPDTPSYELIYRNIARYRKDHPRIHSIPLDEKEKELIDKFIKKWGNK